MRPTILLLLSAVLFGAPALAPASDAALGLGPSIVAPLKVLKANARYFADGRGQAVYLTGSHTWLNFQGRVDGSRPAVNFADYLNLLDQFQHNFIRLWIWEDARHVPLPFQRSGRALARDGKPKFDLNELDPEFFVELRSRVLQAQQRGLYVSVMLFQGWSVEARGNDRDPWRLHPFHRDNNVNGIDGDPDGDGEGKETHTLRLAQVTEIQKRYVKAVIDALNDLDNVLWEIANESHAGSTEWQYRLIRYIREEESKRSKQHPIGMTLQFRGDMGALFNSPADWISPGSSNEQIADRYRKNPPPTTGAKVMLADTDHLFSERVAADPAWIWKSFTRGYHPIFMDAVHQARWRPVRQALGDTLKYARRLDLKHTVPCGTIASTGYCLAGHSPGRREYLVYLPVERQPLHSWIERLPQPMEFWTRSQNPLRSGVTVDLSGVNEPLRAEWFNPATGERFGAPPAKGGAKRSFKAPFSGPAVLYLTGP